MLNISAINQEHNFNEKCTIDGVNFESPQEAAVSLLDRVIEWFTPETNEHYDEESCAEAIEAFIAARDEVKNHEIDLLELDESWLSDFGFDFMTFATYEDMTQEEERNHLLAVIEVEGVSIINHPECMAVLLEELNNDILSQFESDYPELAYPDGGDEADYSGLTSDMSSALLSKVTSSMSDDVLLGYGDNYSIMREAYNNEILEQHESKLVAKWQ